MLMKKLPANLRSRILSRSLIKDKLYPSEQYNSDALDANAHPREVGCPHRLDVAGEPARHDTSLDSRGP